MKKLTINSYKSIDCEECSKGKHLTKKTPTLNHPLNLHLHIPKEGSKCLPIWCFPVLVSSGHWWQTDPDLSYIHILKQLLWTGRIFWGRNASLIGSSEQSFKMLTGGSLCMFDASFPFFPGLAKCNSEQTQQNNLCSSE